MKLAIIGSRNCPEIDIEPYLKELNPNVIISGGAKVVDTYAKEYANSKGIKFVEFLPNYGRFKQGAPKERNKQIVDECDCVLAFWDGKSHGTKFTLNYA